jgi:hypothetical protein
MIPHLLLALLFAPVNVPGAALDRSSPPEDPCGLARRIAEAPPCLDPSDCEAVELWRQSFGAPKVFQARPEAPEGLPRALASRLPDREITLREEKEPLLSVLRRLAAASELEALVDRSVTGDFRGEPGTVPLDEAWRRVLTSGRLSVAVQGKVVMVGSSRGWPGRRTVSSFNCPAR